MNNNVGARIARPQPIAGKMCNKVFARFYKSRTKQIVLLQNLLTKWKIYVKYFKR